MGHARPLRIGTRGSRLALWQAQTVAKLLEVSGLPSELVVITTAGDRRHDATLAEAGGKRIFVKEIEEALLAGAIDLAVHSAKDMPSELPEGLEIGAALEREDPRDALVLRGPTPAVSLQAAVQRLGATPVVGTSAVRRTAQLRALWSGAAFVPIRGNVDTRLRKLDEGGYDALVLASAGMRRLGVEARITAPLPVDDCVPAPGQGIIAVQIRSDDRSTRKAVELIHHQLSGAALTAERAVVAALGGGCQLPLGALAMGDGVDSLTLRAVVASPDGAKIIRREARGLVSAPAALGRVVATELSRGGAAQLLDESRHLTGRDQ